MPFIYKKARRFERVFKLELKKLVYLGINILCRISDYSCTKEERNAIVIY